MARKEKKDRKDKHTDILVDVAFGKKNMLFFGAGMISIVLVFVLLGTGSTVLAPIMLVLGYLVLFPLGILLK